MAYGDLDEAVDIANDTEYGLSAVISGDPAKAADVAPKLRAGMVAVNAWGPGPGAAFGGYKASGNGREGGVFGLKDFMEVKRSEEHTSELQSLMRISYAVFCLKKKRKKKT